ncbi:MAG: ATP-dependent RNA helicase RhlE [Elusimicrobia bacterium]|nr:ATP-dependent RNA helicase RhlE [Elusimicrobiota bacterium]
MLFSEFNLDPRLIQAVEALGFTQPTPVQEQAIPHALLGHDIRACAQTGSGKTIAFTLPILNKLLIEQPSTRPSALIVVPTRELAVQVETVVRDAGKFTNLRCAVIVGGASFEKQTRQIRAGAQIIAATPGRLLDHMQQHTFNLKSVSTLVLDEADRMLDMGFLPDIRRILSACPPKKQTMLFSATFPPEIQALVTTFLNEPKIVDLSPSLPSSNVAQMIYPISRSQKEALLQAIFENASISSALIFCRTKHGADHLVMRLIKMGKSVGVIHSNKSQSERYAALEGFRAKKFQILVATDIASRGIDIKDISHVINFDVPQHPEDYVHRIGRTGRADASGDAFTLVAPDEEPYLKRIEKFINKTLPRGVIPNFPYLVQPQLISKPKSLAESFGKFRRRIPTGSSRRFR